MIRLKYTEITGDNYKWLIDELYKKCDVFSVSYNENFYNGINVFENCQENHNFNYENIVSKLFNIYQEEIRFSYFFNYDVVNIFKDSISINHFLNTNKIDEICFFKNNDVVLVVDIEPTAILFRKDIIKITDFYKRKLI